MSTNSNPLQSPIETKNRNSINYTVERDGLNMPLVPELSFTHHYTGNITRGTEDQKATLRHILMTYEIGTETIAQAELRAAALPQLSPVMAKYSGYLGIEDANRVNGAMGNMGQGMVQRSVMELHEFMHRVDDQLEGRARHEFAAPRVTEHPANEDPRHGVTQQNRPSGIRQV